MVTRNTLYALVVCSVISQGIGSGSDYYVSATSGNDGNPGTIDRPFKTIQKARDTVRAIGVNGHTVYIRGGTHRLASPLTFDERDSGVVGAPNVYRNYPGESVTISGGQLIEGEWSLYSNDIYVCNVGTKRFRSLWVDGVRATRAREPDEDPTTDYTDYYIAQTTPDASQAMGFAEGDINSRWTNLKQVEIQFLRQFTSPRQRIASVDDVGNVVRFNRPMLSDFTRFYATNRYWVENVFEGLDEPGEWYLNTSTNRLYYYPLDGKHPNASTMVAGNLGYRGSRLVGTLVHCNGADYLEFHGVTFAHADWYFSDIGWTGYERQLTESDGGPQYIGSAPAVFILGGTMGWRIQDCTFTHIGGHALQIYGNDITVSQCTFSDIGASPIHVGESPGATGYTETYDITIADNVIRGYGVVFPGGKGIVVKRAHHVTVMHNSVSEGRYMGIQMGGGGTTDLQYNNSVIYNEVFNVCDPLHDAAAI